MDDRWYFVAGRRAVEQRGPMDFRVVCATCGEGGAVSYQRPRDAARIAFQESEQRCTNKDCMGRKSG
jgi:hypothetical protein